MFIRSLYNPIMRNAEGGEGGGGGSPDIAAMIAAEVAKVTGGLKAKNDELLNEVKREREKRTQIEQQLQGLGNQDDIQKARELWERMQADADMRTIVEGGKPAFEEVLTRRTKSVIEAERKAVEEAKRAAAEAQARAEQAQNRWRMERLNAEVSGATAKAKALPEAAEYIKMKAEQLFSLDDDSGKVILRDNLPDTPIDRNGNPHTLDTWVESLRDTNPFFFGLPQGGGAQGGTGRDGKHVTKIDPRDARAFGNNLEAIASGKAVLG
jgi:hypothetical protein